MIREQTIILLVVILELERLYLICYLAQFGDPIVYTVKDKCIKFSSDGVWEGEFATWYIVDAKDPKYVNARTVLITSQTQTLVKIVEK